MTVIITVYSGPATTVGLRLFSVRPRRAAAASGMSESLLGLV